MKTRTMMIFLIGLLLIFSCKKNSNTSAQDTQLEFKVVAENLDIPWELAEGPDGKIWFTERGGRISRLDRVTGQVTPLLTIPDVEERGEGGLLGLALHPNFEHTPQVFVVYNYDQSGYQEKVLRYTYNAANNTLGNPVILLDHIDASNIHNGSRLAFSPDGTLWITTGDAADPDNAQDDASLNGKILRINTDGSIPSDNPSPSSPVWTKGHRNAQGLVFANKRLYSSEHGPNSDDEINIIEKGRNYGWPNVNGKCDQNNERDFCNSNNVKEPVYAWTPTLAVCGIDYYNSGSIPQWKNSLLMATLKDNTLYQIKLNAAGDAVEKVSEIFRDTYGRLRDVCVTADGKIYVSTSNGSNNKIIEIRAKK